MATLAIDYGEKRVGLAIAGQEDSRPRRLKVVANTDELLSDLAMLVERHEVSTVVVGLPRNLDGDDTAQTKVVRGFGARLVARLPEVKLVFQDEADTSNQARQRLEREGLIGDEAKRWVDAEAAAIILEDYLGGS